MPVIEEDLAWIALQNYGRVGPKMALDAYSKFESLSQLWNLSESQVESLNHDIRQATSSIDLEKQKRILGEIRRNKINLIRYIDINYPAALKRISGKEAPPLLLFHKGNLLSFENCVAVVGTRKCTQRAYEFARTLGRSLAHRGYTVVSGLARGIDASAHHGALSARGKTVAVLAWMKNPYPPEHVRLLDNICETGAALSENYEQSATSRDRFKFVERNRIISGISECVIAVESGETGGTSWQVKIAIEQKKKVLAVKPSLGDEIANSGFKSFISMGAEPVNSVREIISFLEGERKNWRQTRIEAWERGGQ